MERRESNPILVIAMLAVLVLLGINLYPGAIEKLRAQQLNNPVSQPTYVPVIINPVQQPQSQPAVMIVTATPLPVVVSEPTQAPPTQVPEPTAVIEVSQEGSDGRFITFVDANGDPVSGLVIEHYIEGNVAKNATNPHGIIKIYMDYIRIDGGEWIYIEGLSLITVK